MDLTLRPIVQSDCAALVRRFEGCRLGAYRPTPTDRPTIGWGATYDAGGIPVRLGQRWTQAKADARLAADLDSVGRQVGDLLGHAATTAPQLAALTAFAYNVGMAALAGSSLLALHRAGRTTAAAAQFARWNHQGRTVLAGLTRRRAAEAALYLSAELRPAIDAAA